MSQQPDKKVVDLVETMFDPFGVWRSAREGEANPYVKLTAEILSAYAEANSKVIDAYVAAFPPLPGFAQTTSAPVVKQLNLVTQADLAALEERLARLEQRLDEGSGSAFDSIKQVLKGGSGS